MQEQWAVFAAIKMIFTSEQLEVKQLEANAIVINSIESEFDREAFRAIMKFEEDFCKGCGSDGKEHTIACTEVNGCELFKK